MVAVLAVSVVAIVKRAGMVRLVMGGVCRAAVLVIALVMRAVNALVFVMVCVNRHCVMGYAVGSQVAIVIAMRVIAVLVVLVTAHVGCGV